jgi:hypothetical protein
LARRGSDPKARCAPGLISNAPIALRSQSFVSKILALLEEIRPLFSSCARMPKPLRKHDFFVVRLFFAEQ